MGRDDGCPIESPRPDCFNPRARVGRDLPMPSLCIDLFCFNPRARVGRDLILLLRLMLTSRFNPRARVGRDPDMLESQNVCACFNPRARVGRDVCNFGHKVDSLLFQSTRPRGARLFMDTEFVDGLPVSIHAPAWGATNINRRIDYVLQVSIHAPAWGATASHGT